MPTELGNHYTRWDVCNRVASLVESEAVHNLHNCTWWPRPHHMGSDWGDWTLTLSPKSSPSCKNHPPWRCRLGRAPCPESLPCCHLPTFVQPVPFVKNFSTEFTVFLVMLRLGHIPGIFNMAVDVSSKFTVAQILFFLISRNFYLHSTSATSATLP